MKLLALQGRSVKSQLLPERQHLVLEYPRFHDFVHDVALESMLLAPRVQTHPLPVVLAVEVLVVDPVVEPIPRSTTTMIKASPVARTKML